MTVPTIAFLLLGGVVSDRFDRRRVMLAADVVRGLAVGADGACCRSPARSSSGTSSRSSAVYGAGTAFFAPAFDAIVPEVLPAGELAAGQRARPVRAADRAAAGRPGARRRADRRRRRRRGVRARRGVVRRLGGRAAGDGAGRAPRRPRGRAARVARDMRDGLRATSAATSGCGRRSPAPRSPTCCSWARPRCCCPFVVKNDLHGSAADLGLVFAAGGIGSVGCAVVMGQRGLPRRDITFMYVDVDAGHARGRGLRPGLRGVAADAGQPRVQRAGDRGHDRLGHRQAAPRPRRAARPRLEPRLADLDRPAAAVLRAHRARSAARSARRPR